MADAACLLLEPEPRSEMSSGSQHSLGSQCLKPRWPYLVSGFVAGLVMAVVWLMTTTAVSPTTDLRAPLPLRLPAALLRTILWPRPQDSKAFSCKTTRLRIKGSVPAARSSHSISVAGGAAYLLGGEHVARTPIDSTLYRLDLAAPRAAWAVVECGGDVPPPRVAHSQAVVPQADGAAHLYIFGGRVGISMDEKPLNDLHRAVLSPDGRAGTWEALQAKGRVPSPRSFHVMAAIGDQLYVFGGCGATGRLSELHRLDTPTLTWTQLPSLPAAGRGGAGFFASRDGKSLFVIAGFAGEEMADLHRFSVEDGKWTELHVDLDRGDFLRPRSVYAHATLQPSGHLVIIGGEVNPSDKGHEGAGGFARDVLLVDASGDGDAVVIHSSKMPKAFEPRGWYSAAATQDGRVVLFGGLAGDDEAPHRLDDTWVLSDFVIPNA